MSGVDEGEAGKSKHITAPYLTGNVLDLGSGGMPCVPHAVQMDRTRIHKPPFPPVQIVGDIFTPLPFREQSFTANFSSHALEDAMDWDRVLREWVRVVSIHGHILIQVPDKIRFREAVASGRNTPNLAHQHESYPGELTSYFNRLFPNQFGVIMDRYVPDDSYNILFIAKRLV